MVVLDLKTVTDRSSNPDLPSRTGIEEAAANPSFELVSRLLSAIQRHVLTGDSFQDLNDTVDGMRAHFCHPIDLSKALEHSAQLDEVLESYQKRICETNRETATDFKKVLNLVNESFSCIQSGNDKADGRLKYFEKSLNQASQMDSLTSLRRHLSGMVDFVQKEGRRDQIEKEANMRSITDQLRQAHAATSRFRNHLPGRPEALEHFRTLLANQAMHPESNVTLFSVDSLAPLRARHGEEIASAVLEELGRKQIQPLAPEGKLFCWSGTSLVLAWSHQFGKTACGLLNAVPFVFEHRAFIGTRVATFKIIVRPWSTALSGALEELIADLDRTSKEKAAS